MLFDKDQSKLATLILDEEVKGLCAIPMPELTLNFADRWQYKKPFNTLGQHEGPTMVNSSISAMEVYKNLKEMKKGTAAGPDGMTGERLKLGPKRSQDG